MRLQTKLLLILAPAFLVVFCVNVIVNYRSAQRDALVNLQREASNIRGLLMATRRVYHHQFLESGLSLNSKTVGFLPAHALSRISRDFENWSGSGLVFNNVSDRPRNPHNAADALETEAMVFYRENPRIQERFVPFESEGGESFYHYSRPIWVEQYCLKCHGKREDAPPTIQAHYDSAYDYQEGELRGILSIKLPAGMAQERAAAAFWNSLWFDLAVYAGVSLLVYWLLVRHVVRRLKELGSRCRKLADGDYGSRSDITGNDEIGHLAAVFDGMAERIEDRNAALQASEERARKIVETAHDAFVAIDFGGAITAWNNQAEHIFGWSREAILGQKLAETIIPPQYRDAHLRAMESFRKTGKGASVDRRIEITALHRDGQEFPVELVITQVGSGQTLVFNAFVRNITERKRSEEDLKATLQELQRFNRLAVGREERMIELKREVNEMARKAGAAPPYDSELVEEPATPAGQPISQTSGEPSGA